MVPLKIRPDRSFSVGVTFALSLTILSVMVVIIASAQSGASLVEGDSWDEAEKVPLQNGIVRIEPAVAVVENGEAFRVYVIIYDAVDLGGFNFVMNYDPNIIEVTDPLILGDLIGSTGRSVLVLKNEIGAAGVITYVVATYATGGYISGPSGDGVLASVNLRARDLGTSALDLQDVKITDTVPHTQSVSIEDGLVVVADPPDPTHVSITKTVEPQNVAPQGVLTFTLQRRFSLAGNHKYDEIVFDPIPSGTTYLTGSVILNGLSAPQLYSVTLGAIYFKNSGGFTDTEQLTITFQVQAENLPDGALITNVVTETSNFDGTAYSGPYTGTSEFSVTLKKVYLPVTFKDYP